MSSPAITTVVTMLETLPENLQARVIEHLSEYLEDLQDEREWDQQFQQTQSALTNQARQAKKSIAEGQSTPPDYDQL
jgi:hypothetical protein